MIRKILHKMGSNTAQSAALVQTDAASPRRLANPAGREAALAHHPTPDHVRTTTFPCVHHGYDPEAVHQFLDLMAEEIARLQKQVTFGRLETDRIIRHPRGCPSDSVITNCDPDTRDLNYPRAEWPINR